MYKKALLLNQNGDEFLGWTTELFQPLLESSYLIQQ